MCIRDRGEPGPLARQCLASGPGSPCRNLASGTAQAPCSRPSICIWSERQGLRTDPAHRLFVAACGLPRKPRRLTQPDAARRAFHQSAKQCFESRAARLISAGCSGNEPQAVLWRGAAVRPAALDILVPSKARGTQYICLRSRCLARPACPDGWSLSRRGPARRAVRLRSGCGGVHGCHAARLPPMDNGGPGAGTAGSQRAHGPVPHTRSPTRNLLRLPVCAREAGIGPGEP